MDRLAAIELFVRVVDTGSFSAAARTQGLGQPAVSKAVAQLEEWLGVRLLLRSTRSLVITDAGKSFYDRAKRAVEEAGEAVHAARGTGAELTGRLRVSAPICFSRLHLVPKLSRFLADHPGLDIELVLNEGPVDLVDEAIDVALCTGEMPDSNMIARKIGEARRRVVGTPQFFLQHGSPTTPSALTDLPAVAYTQDLAGKSRIFRRGPVNQKVESRGRLAISSSDGLRAAVKSDLGYTIASEWVFGEELRSGSVVSVLDDWELEPLGLYSVYPAGRLMNAKARAFIAFVEATMADGETLRLVA